MSVKKRTLNNSNKRVKSAKKVTKRDSDTPYSPWLEDYRDTFSMRVKPISSSFITRLSKELVKWSVSTDTALTLGKFYIMKGILKKTFYKWVKKYPEMTDAHSVAMQIIGIRREEGALTRKFEPSTVKHTMPLYCEDIRELELWRSKLKENENSQIAPSVVVLDKIPDSPLVPKRK